LHRAIEEHKSVVAAETLAQEVVFNQTFPYETACSIDDVSLTISLQKAFTDKT
jgi:hypothetical protein